MVTPANKFIGTMSKHLDAKYTTPTMLITQSLYATKKFTKYGSIVNKTTMSA